MTYTTTTTFQPLYTPQFIQIGNVIVRRDSIYYIKLVGSMLSQNELLIELIDGATITAEVHAEIPLSQIFKELTGVSHDRQDG